MDRVPQETMIRLVMEKLTFFEVDLDADVVAVTSDGASDMVKFGKLSPSHQQLCYNHIIHFAVMSVMYARRKSRSDKVVGGMNGNENDGDDNNIELGDDSDVGEGGGGDSTIDKDSVSNDNGRGGAMAVNLMLIVVMKTTSTIMLSNTSRRSNPM